MDAAIARFQHATSDAEAVAAFKDARGRMAPGCWSQLASQLLLACARSGRLATFSVLNRLCSAEQPLDFVCRGTQPKCWEIGRARDLQLELHAQALTAACKVSDWKVVG
jgi:hypothetical protein